MELGPHADDVLDIVDLVESGTIFRDPRPPFGMVRVIRDMAEVRNYLHASPDVPEDDRFDWQDLLEWGGELGSKINVERHMRRRAVPELTESLAGLMDGPIERALERQLSHRYTGNDIRFIWGTIDYILNFRATFGRTLPFIERLVEIYRLGGHPCGWIGHHPKGQLVAYFPPRDEGGEQTDLLGAGLRPRPSSDRRSPGLPFDVRFHGESEVGEEDPRRMN